MIIITTITATRQFDTVSTVSTAIDPLIYIIDFGRRCPIALKTGKEADFIRQTSRLQYRLKPTYLPVPHIAVFGFYDGPLIIPCVPRVTRSEREANQSRPTTVKPKNDGRYNPIPSIRLHGFYSGISPF